MDLSIIIPMFNVENYISQCLQSILDQKTSNIIFEIIIIDDGSSDQSFFTAKEFLKSNKNIKIYRQKNRGVSITRNRGIDLATGKFIWFIDADDFIFPNTIEKLVYTINKYHLDMLEFKLVRTKSRDINFIENGDLKKNKINVMSGGNYIATRSFNDSSCVYLINRNFLLNSKVRFIENRIMEDMLFNAELIPKSKKIAFCPINVYLYAINPNSIWTSTNSQILRKSIYDFIFMTKKYSALISELKNKNIDTSKLEIKQQNMLFNIEKRIIRSDFNISEIYTILNDLHANNLYPFRLFKEFEKNRKLITYIFNNKYLLFLAKNIYRIFRKPFEEIIVKNHQKKREAKLTKNQKKI